MLRAQRLYGEELSRLEDEQIILSKDKYIVIGIPKEWYSRGRGLFSYSKHRL